MRRLVAFALIALAGCGVRGDDRTIDQGRVDELLLRPADVGTGFRPAYVSNPADRPSAEVRYRQVPRLRGFGPLTIHSSAAVFVSSDVAEESLQAERTNLKDKPHWQLIDEPGLGDESFAATVVQQGGRSYTVVWRDDNATASLDVSSLDDKFPFAEVFELAQKQQRRIADVAA
jgi:hypothetical protein